VEAGTEGLMHIDKCEKYWYMGLIHWQANKIFYSSNATLSLCHFLSSQQVNMSAVVIKLFTHGLAYHVLPLYGNDMGTNSIRIRQRPHGF
jgi:hypothetical protein